MRASGINRAFMQARSVSAGPLIAASIAAGMPLGSEGNAQPASGACAIAVPASAPARIVPENNVRSIFFSLANGGRCPRIDESKSLDPEAAALWPATSLSPHGLVTHGRRFIRMGAPSTD